MHRSCACFRDLQHGPSAGRPRKENVDVSVCPSSNRKKALHPGSTKCLESMNWGMKQPAPQGPNALDVFTVKCEATALHEAPKGSSWEIPRSPHLWKAPKAREASKRKRKKRAALTFLRLCKKNTLSHAADPQNVHTICARDCFTP